MNRCVLGDKRGSQTLEFVSNSPFEDLEHNSWKTGGHNLNKIFEAAIVKAQMYSADEWFCVVTSPLAEAPMANQGSDQAEDNRALISNGSKGPILKLDAADELVLLNSKGRYEGLALLYNSSYLPPSSLLGQKVDASIGKVDMYVQGELVDFSRSAWNDLDQTGLLSESPVLAVATTNAYGSDGKVAFLQYKTFEPPRLPTDKDMKYGVLVASKSSTRFLNTDPKAFYADELCTTRVTRDTCKQILFDRLLGKDSYNTKHSKIKYQTLTSYMDKTPNFSAADWSKFEARCKVERDGMARMRRAIGMACLCIVSLEVDMKTDYPKSRLDTDQKPREGDEPRPDPATLIGAIYRTLVEALFAEEFANLKQTIEQRQAKAQAAAKRSRVEDLDDDDDEEEEVDAEEEDEGGAAPPPNSGRTTGRMRSKTKRFTAGAGPSSSTGGRGSRTVTKSQSKDSPAKRTLKSQIDKLGSVLNAEGKSDEVKLREIQEIFDQMNSAKDNL